MISAGMETPMPLNAKAYRKKWIWLSPSQVKSSPKLSTSTRSIATGNRINHRGPHHPGHALFSLPSSGRRYGSLRTHNTRVDLLSLPAKKMNLRVVLGDIGDGDVIMHARDSGETILFSAAGAGGALESSSPRGTGQGEERFSRVKNSTLDSVACKVPHRSSRTHGQGTGPLNETTVYVITPRHHVSKYCAGAAPKCRHASSTNFACPQLLTRVCLDCGRKTEHPEETHMVMVGTYKLLTGTAGVVKRLRCPSCPYDSTSIPH
ncbi:uncharacterized protein LOC132382908 [Hypanus sabinus]|uniref:uncharacterized protein LOC132382908 n=1 Tax=Hypanus sabinus TaxID=79690 RepID=UPI0028C4206D|nr:uncharacterized protein LOC132382908 [Hypanus sabinus]